ncbi:MAG TPA: hypothetical protein VHQ22_14955, partial [Terriglobales bacterium]|nr:hypothetical protein [Terriglobales bacterium]
MARLIFSLILIITLAGGCWAQAPAGTAENESAKVRADTKFGTDSKTAKAAEPPYLTVVETITSPTEIGNGFAGLSCDEDGNIFLGLDGSSAPAVRKLNPKGELATLFKPYSNPDIDLMNVGNYAVTGDGELYILASPKDGNPWHIILVFRSDGSYKTNIKLDPGFGWTPASLAVFANGNILITGQKVYRDQKRMQEAFTGIFRSDGRLLKTIELEDDTHLHDLAKSGPPTSPLIPTSNRAVSWGMMRAARDGNIYVMRALSPAIIYAVSPSGETVRRFTVDPDDASMLPLQMLISGNNISVQFTNLESHDSVVKIADLQGKEINTYKISRAEESRKPNYGVSSVYGCYAATPQHFTFLTSN